MQTKRLSA